MHDTAYDIGRRFFRIYGAQPDCTILEVGSQNVNGTLRDVAPDGSTYVGVDMVAGDGVDVVLSDPHTLPFANEHFDIALASSCFEHDPMFWVTFLEMLRITKTGGYLYLNTPSNGDYHGYPYDNWRFYPDAGLALANWARREGRAVTLIESFVARRRADIWNDCVLVFRKGPDDGGQTHRIADDLPESYNIRRGETAPVVNFITATEDAILRQAAREDLAAKDREIDRLKATIASSEAALAGLVGSITAASEPRFAALTDAVAATTAQLAALRSTCDALAAQLAPVRAGLERTAAVVEDLRRHSEPQPAAPAADESGRWQRLLHSIASRPRR